MQQRRSSCFLGRFGAGLALFLAAWLVGPPGGIAQSQAATCGYGTGGPSASSLCWFDLTGYDDAAARSVAGQPTSINLPGGYVASFKLTSRPVPGDGPHLGVAAQATPLEERFAYGSSGADGGYRGVPGKPALYSAGAQGVPSGVSLTLSNITVVDSGGQPVTGYRFVIADAENNINGENFTFTSDKALNLVGVLNDDASTGCNVPPNNLAGLGTTTVTCTGSGTGDPAPNPLSDAVVVGAETPSTIGLSLRTFARSGVAFAIQTSKIQVTKSVVGRAKPTDSFDVSATSPGGTTIGSATTGPSPSNSATTGELTVLPRSNGAFYTLSDAVTPGSGTQASDYTQNWVCTNNGVADPALPSGSGTSVQVSPVAGDDIECTVTNRLALKPQSCGDSLAPAVANFKPRRPVLPTRLGVRAVLTASTPSDVTATAKIKDARGRFTKLGTFEKKVTTFKKLRIPVPSSLGLKRLDRVTLFLHVVSRPLGSAICTTALTKDFTLKRRVFNIERARADR